MILKPNIHFIHIPKTGGISIVRMFNPEYVGDHKKPTSAELNGCYSFTFIRHPFDRFISAFEYQKKLVKSGINLKMTLRKRMLDMDFNFEEFVDSLEYKEIIGSLHYKPQHFWLDGLDIDYIGRVENFEIDVNNILININEIDKINKLEHHNKSERGGIDSYLSSQHIKNKLIKLYDTDFNLLSYNPLLKG